MATNAEDIHPAAANSHDEKVKDAKRKKANYQRKTNQQKLENATRIVMAVGIDPKVGLDPSHPKRMFNKEIIAEAKQIKEWRLAATILGPIRYNELKEKGELALERKKKLQAIAAQPSVKTPVARRPSGARPSTISKEKKDDAEAAIAATDAAIVGRPSGSALVNTSIDRSRPVTSAKISAVKTPVAQRPSGAQPPTTSKKKKDDTSAAIVGRPSESALARVPPALTNVDRSRPVTSAKISAGSLKDDSYDEVTNWVENVNNTEEEINYIEETKGMANQLFEYENKVLEADQRDEEALVALEDDVIAAKEAAAKKAEEILEERKARQKENQKKRHEALAQMKGVTDVTNRLCGKQFLLKKDLHRLQQGAFLDQGKFGTLPTESEVRVDRCQTILENPIMCRDLKHDLDNASMASPQPVFTPSAFEKENDSTGSHPTIDLNQYAIDDLGNSSNDDDDDAWDDSLAGSLHRLIIPKLKEILKGMGLPVSGKKSVLIERLVKSGRKEEVIQRMAAFVNE